MQFCKLQDPKAGIEKLKTKFEMIIATKTL